MQKMRNLRVYYIGVLCLTLVATLTRTLSLTLSLDKASGYFKANAVLPVALVVVLALAGVAILLYPILLRDRVPQSNAGGSNLTTATSILCALLFLVSFVATCMAKGVVALPTFLWLVGILSLLAATIYFLTKTSLCSSATLEAYCANIQAQELTFSCIVATPQAISFGAHTNPTRKPVMENRLERLSTRMVRSCIPGISRMLRKLPSNTMVR